MPVQLAFALQSPVESKPTSDDCLPFAMPVSLWGDVTLERTAAFAWKITLTPKVTFRHFFTSEAFRDHQSVLAHEAYEVLEREIELLTRSIEGHAAVSMVRFKEEPYVPVEGGRECIRLAAYLETDR